MENNHRHTHLDTIHIAMNCKECQDHPYVVKFRKGRDGGPITHIGNAVAFPSRSGMQPAIGEEWEAIIEGMSKSGRVYYLRLLRRM
jgi:hypothetical protein